MWLKYGVDRDNALVSIEDALSGKTFLTCLYCGGGLTAKKGKIKEHHFAHTEETCRPVANRVAYQDLPSLPLYDSFNIQLSGKELEELKVFWKNYGVRNEGIFVKPSWRLVSSKMLAWNDQGVYEFTDLGKIPIGALSLELFNEVQEPLLLNKLSKLEGIVQRAKLINSRHLAERVADYRIYCAQLKRILECNLYFLEVKAGRKTLHKIGVTKRPIEERVVEIQKDLALHYKSVEIKVIDIWRHRVFAFFRSTGREQRGKILTHSEIQLFFNGGLPNTFSRIMSKPQPYLVQDDHVAIAKHRVANFSL
jgi:hypothetical protein